MADMRNERMETTEDRSQPMGHFQAFSESMEGLEATSEMVSDIYKMGTIDDREGAD